MSNRTSHLIYKVSERPKSSKPMVRHMWTQLEIKKMMELKASLDPKYRLKDISDMLGISIVAIKGKRYELKKKQQIS